MATNKQLIFPVLVPDVANPNNQFFQLNFVFNALSGLYEIYVVDTNNNGHTSLPSNITATGTQAGGGGGGSTVGWAGSRAANQATPQNAHTILIPDTILDNQGGLLNLATGVMTAPSAGYYSFFGSILASAGTACFARIWLNPTIVGGAVTAGTQVTYSQFNASADFGRVAATLYLPVNAVVVFTCATNNGAGANLTALQLVAKKV
jgi:hypothetical protein